MRRGVMKVSNKLPRRLMVGCDALNVKVLVRFQAGLPNTTPKGTGLTGKKAVDL